MKRGLVSHPFFVRPLDEDQACTMGQQEGWSQSSGCCSRCRDALPSSFRFNAQLFLVSSFPPVVCTHPCDLDHVLPVDLSSIFSSGKVFTLPSPSHAVSYHLPLSCLVSPARATHHLQLIDLQLHEPYFQTHLVSKRRACKPKPVPMPSDVQIPPLVFSFTTMGASLRWTLFHARPW